jgi:hypothetical protein
VVSCGDLRGVFVVGINFTFLKIFLWKFVCVGPVQDYWEIVIWDVLLRLRILPDCGQKGMING